MEARGCLIVQADRTFANRSGHAAFMAPANSRPETWEAPPAGTSQCRRQPSGQRLEPGLVGAAFCAQTRKPSARLVLEHDGPAS